MWTLMCACGELDASDIDDLQYGFIPLDPLGTTPASLRDGGPFLSISTSAPAVPLPAPTSQLTLPPETFDALAWHVGTKNPSIINNLHDTLPTSIVLHHTDLYKAHLSAQTASKALVPLPKPACTRLHWPPGRPTDKFRLQVCERFHAFKGCDNEGSRLPRNTVTKFIAAHIDCSRLAARAIAR